MKLTVLNSGSRANGYVIQNDDEAIIIETGCSIGSCLKVLGFNTKKVKACLVTHEHGDHCRYISQYLEFMPVYCTKGTIEGITFKGAKRPHEVHYLESFNAGGFVVMPFKTQHDVREPAGFLIQHPDMGLLLFATDTWYLDYQFEGLTQVMLECNYDKDMLDRNIENGNIHPCVRERTLESHMSLKTTINTLQSNDLSKVNNVILLHLSKQNSDAKMFKAEVERSIGKHVTIASPNVEVILFNNQSI